VPRLLYVDTSAVLDVALAQKHHQSILAALIEHGKSGGRLVASRLLQLEARRAYIRESLSGNSIPSVLEVAAQIMPLPVSDQVWDDAYAIQHHVRTLDALHLATCQLVGAVLLSTDAGMLHVAEELELKVHPASYG